MTRQTMALALIGAVSLSLSGCNALLRTGVDLAPVEDRTGTPVIRVAAAAPALTAAVKVFAPSDLTSRRAPRAIGGIDDDDDTEPVEQSSALDDAREAQTLAPLALTAPRRGDIARARPTPVLEPPSNPAARALVQAGTKHESAGRFEQAAASYERALEIAPNDAWLWHRLAKVRAAQGQRGLAQALARRSNALGSGDPAVERANEPLMRAL